MTPTSTGMSANIDISFFEKLSYDVCCGNQWYFASFCKTYCNVEHLFFFRVSGFVPYDDDWAFGFFDHGYYYFWFGYDQGFGWSSDFCFLPRFSSCHFLGFLLLLP